MPGPERAVHRFASLCRTVEVRDLIWAEIERVNQNFARVETIKKFRMMKAAHGEDDEVTPDAEAQAQSS